MEYSLEKDQIEMMNLSQKIQTARMENVKMSALKEISKQESLFRNVEAAKTTLLVGHLVERQQLDTVGVRYEGFGLEVREDTADQQLLAGDRVIEVNGEDVLRLLPAAWASMLEAAAGPVKVVVLRAVAGAGAGDSEGGGAEGGAKFSVRHVAGLKDDIAMIQSRLSEKLREGRHVSLELAAVQQQRDDLAGDNTRLQHRIHFLQDQVANLESGMKQVSAVTHKLLSHESPNHSFKHLDTYVFKYSCATCGTAANDEVRLLHFLCPALNG